MDSPMLIVRENKICIEVTDSYFYPIKEGDILLLKGKVVEYANGCFVRNDNKYRDCQLSV